MKKLTKILCLVLCLSLCASVLAACGGNETAKDENQTDFYIMGGMSALSAGYDSNVVLNELAENAGIDSIVVLSGEATLEETLAEEIQPTVIAEHLGAAWEDA